METVHPRGTELDWNQSYTLSDDDSAFNFSEYNFSLVSDSSGSNNDTQGNDIPDLLTMTITSTVLGLLILTTVIGKVLKFGPANNSPVRFHVSLTYLTCHSRVPPVFPTCLSPSCSQVSHMSLVVFHAVHNA